jgi:hypothetical protein
VCLVNFQIWGRFVELEEANFNGKLAVYADIVDTPHTLVPGQRIHVWLANGRPTCAKLLEVDTIPDAADERPVVIDLQSFIDSANVAAAAATALAPPPPPVLSPKAAAAAGEDAAAAPSEPPVLPGAAELAPQMAALAALVDGFQFRPVGLTGRFESSPAAVEVNYTIPPALAPQWSLNGVVRGKLQEPEFKRDEPIHPNNNLSVPLAAASEAALPQPKFVMPGAMIPMMMATVLEPQVPWLIYAYKPADDATAPIHLAHSCGLHDTTNVHTMGYLFESLACTRVPASQTRLPVFKGKPSFDEVHQQLHATVGGVPVLMNYELDAVCPVSGGDKSKYARMELKTASLTAQFDKQRHLKWWWQSLLHGQDVLAEARFASAGVKCTFDPKDITFTDVKTAKTYSAPPFAVANGRVEFNAAHVADKVDPYLLADVPLTQVALSLVQSVLAKAEALCTPGKFYRFYYRGTAQDGSQTNVAPTIECIELTADSNPITQLALGGMTNQTTKLEWAADYTPPPVQVRPRSS